MMKNFYSLLIVFFITKSFCFAQYKIVSGNVYAFKNLPLRNIQITAKEAKTSVHSDSLGNFNIACAEKDKLVFSGQGFQKLIRRINEKETTIKAKMFFKGGIKNQAFAITSGHVSKKDIENSITHFSNYNNDYSNFSDIFSLIQSKFPNVQIVNEEKGSKKLIIRGINSIMLDSYALYVVNGVVVDEIQYIAPYNVKDIYILKDAAIYGARGANGVLIITTVGN